MASSARRSGCCSAPVRRGKCLGCGSVARGFLPQGTAKATPAQSGRVFSIFAPSAGGGSSREAAARPRPPAGAPNAWSAADDKLLWERREELSVARLAQMLGRGEGAIIARIAHLGNPTHKAHQRLRGGPAAAAASLAPAADAGQLNAKQREAVELARRGRSLFLTGGAGTGKSFTLGFVVRELQRLHGREAVFVTASTGIAACHVGGTTLHSFAGVGLGEGTAAELAGRVLRSRAATARWQTARALVVDEVSMLDGSFFEKVEAVARRVTGREAEPFGGLQLVLCGDFFQLPPVARGGERARFLFETSCWRAVAEEQVNLTEVFRQEERGFVELLNQMRRGALSPANDALLKAHLRRCLQAQRARSQAAAAAGGGGEGGGGGGGGGAGAGADAGAGAGAGGGAGGSGGVDGSGERLKLYAHNAPADVENARRLALLGGARRVYVSADSGKMDGCLAPPSLELALGAQVMLLKNLDPAARLVNGSRGVVIGFRPAAPALALASSPPLDSLQPAEWDALPSADAAARATAAAEGELPEGAEPTGLFPVVLFEGGGEARLLPPEEWTIEQGGRVLARRVQVPLKLSYAISIHKSQGMTLSSLEVDLAPCFEPGHAYVALSRGTSLESTALLSYEPRAVRAHPAVLAFYAALEGTAVPPPAAPPPAAPPPAASQAAGISDQVRARIAANKAAAVAKRAAAEAAAAAAAAAAVAASGNRATPDAAERLAVAEWPSAGDTEVTPAPPCPERVEGFAEVAEAVEGTGAAIEEEAAAAMETEASAEANTEKVAAEKANAEKAAVEKAAEGEMIKPLSAVEAAAVDAEGARAARRCAAQAAQRAKDEALLAEFAQRRAAKKRKAEAEAAAAAAAEKAKAAAAAAVAARAREARGAEAAPLSDADLAEGGAFAGWTRKRSKASGESYLVSPGGEKLWERQARQRLREMLHASCP